MSTPSSHFSGRPPTQRQEQRIKAVADYWRKVEDEAPVQQVTRSEDAAKQLIGLAGVLQGLYLAVFAFSGLRMQISTLSIPVLRALVWLLFLLPILLWLVSLYCATKVFVPIERDGTNTANIAEHNWQRTKKTYKQAAQDKQSWLQRSHLALIASFAAVLLVFVVFMLLPAVPESSPTQIIIVTPTPVATLLP